MKLRFWGGGGGLQTISLHNGWQVGAMHAASQCFADHQQTQLLDQASGASSLGDVPGLD